MGVQEEGMGWRKNLSSLRLPTNETFPKELHPVFFLFVAAPSVAVMAWANIQGSFDYGHGLPISLPSSFVSLWHFVFPLFLPFYI